MSVTDYYLGKLNKCGIFDCQKYFIISFILTSLFLIIVNMWVYQSIKDYVNQVYPEKPCSSSK